MKTFRTLELAIDFCKRVEGLPATGHLKDQLHRASTSIALNLSEGNARPTSRDKKRFYQTAYASLHECKTILRLLPAKNLEMETMADHLGACLYKLMKAHNPILEK